MKTYEPQEAYAFKSGKREGKTVEGLMFDDYGFLLFLRRKIKNNSSGKNSNRLERHLEWILSRGEDRETSMLCPYCRKRKVSRFSVKYSHEDFSIGPQYTCCDFEECADKLRALSFGGYVELLPFKFSSITRFSSKRDRRAVVSLFKTVFGMSPPLRRDKLFKFFSA